MAAGVYLITTGAVITWVREHWFSNLDGGRVGMVTDTYVCKWGG